MGLGDCHEFFDHPDGRFVAPRPTQCGNNMRAR